MKIVPFTGVETALTFFGKEIEVTGKKMYMKYPAAALSLLLLVTACSKKHQPQGTDTSTIKVTAFDKGSATKKDSVTAKRVVVKRIKTPVPPVLTVDDRAAKKTADGRLYYDLEGHRYWRNYNDGKYYLFNKKMYSDPAFKPH